MEDYDRDQQEGRVLKFDVGAVAGDPAFWNLGAEAGCSQGGLSVNIPAEFLVYVKYWWNGSMELYLCREAVMPQFVLVYVPEIWVTVNLKLRKEDDTSKQAHLLKKELSCIALVFCPSLFVFMWMSVLVNHLCYLNYHDTFAVLGIWCLVAMINPYWC